VGKGNCRPLEKIQQSTCYRKSTPGIQDGTFSNQKSQFGQIFEDLVMEDVGTLYILWSFGIFCGRLVYFVAIIYGNLVYFFLFWYVVPRKIFQS
jgi:hypothetical protein